MDLNTFTIDQLPYQTSDTLPKDCTKYDVAMGAVPDEKDNTNLVPYMDVIFAAGGEQPTPVGPKDNEIWYTGEYYDLANVISILGQQGLSYAGPSILSNEQVGDKYVITFDGPVTKLGAELTGEETRELYPIFMNYSEMGVECNITVVEIPNSVTSIGEGAFMGCSSLASIEIPNSVTSIGDNAFSDCTRLTSIEIPNSVTSIGNAAFDSCSSLTSIIIPNSVTSIEDYAFSDCTRLTSIEIPNSVTSIGDNAFSGCTGLTSATCEATTPPALGGTSVFSSTNNCPIYVPVDSVEAYKEAWSEYASRIQAIQ